MKNRRYFLKYRPLIVCICASFWPALVGADDTFFALSAAGNQTATDVVTDNAGNTYVAGTFSGTVDFAPQVGVTVNRTALGTNRDVYVAAYTAAGTLRWVFQCEGEGSGVHNTTGLCLTTDGDVVVCGSFTGQIRFGTETADPVVTATGSGTDGFVFKLNTAGSAATLAWHAIIECTNSLIPQAVHSVKTTFGAENFAVVGSFNGQAVFDILGGGTASLLSNAGSFDLFVTRLSSFGSSAARLRLGGSGTDQAMDVTFQAVDDWIHVGGSFSGTVDFDPGAGVHNETSTGSGSDGFIASFDQDDLSLVAVSAVHSPVSAVVNAVAWTYNLQGTPSVWIGGDFSQSIGFGDDPEAWRSIGSSAGCFMGRVQTTSGSPLEFSGYLHIMSGLSPNLTSLYVEDGGNYFMAGGITFGFSEFSHQGIFGGEEAFTAVNGDGFLWAVDNNQQHVMARRLGGSGGAIVNDITAPTQWQSSRGFQVIDHNTIAAGAFTGSITAPCDTSLTLVSTTSEDAFISRCMPWPLPQLEVERFFDVGVTVSFTPLKAHDYRLQQSFNLLPPWATRADFVDAVGTKAILDDFETIGQVNFYRLTSLSPIYPPSP